MVSVPFVHADQGAEVDLQVEATGLANLAIDRIRLQPDLREGFRQRGRELAALLGPFPAGGEPSRPSVRHP